MSYQKAKAIAKISEAIKALEEVDYYLTKSIIDWDGSEDQDAMGVAIAGLDEFRCDMNDETPKIYAACLASYNAGTLHGRWIDASLGEDHIEEEIAAMLAASPQEDAEEWSILDYDGPLGPLASWLGANPKIEEVAEIAEALEEHDGDAVKIFIQWFGSWCSSGFAEAYHGHWDGYNPRREFGWQLAIDTVDGLGDRSTLSDYFDYEAFTRDLFMSDYYEEGGHVFRTI